jgi:hypothetical protein
LKSEGTAIGFLCVRNVQIRERPIVYLHLFHGHKNPQQILDDWGLEGPTFGPLEHVASTYAATITFLSENANDYCQLYYDDDTIYYDGVWYGDWILTKELMQGQSIVAFDKSKAQPND